MGSQQTNLYLLQHVASVLDRQLDQVMQEQLGIGQAQFRILHMLKTRHELTQRNLADHVGQTEASISRQTKMLLEKGLVVSRVNPRSRREHVTVITPKGLKITDAAQAITANYTKPFFDGIPEKQQKLLTELLVTLHVWTCQQGRLTSCDHPYHM